MSGRKGIFRSVPNHVDARWCEIAEGRDFMHWQAPVDWIVTNPPWSMFRNFLVHSMRVTKNIVFLAAFNHYGTKASQADIRRHGFGMRSILSVPTPEGFPQSGLHQCAIWLQHGWRGPCEMEELGKT